MAENPGSHALTIWPTYQEFLVETRKDSQPINNEAMLVDRYYVHSSMPPACLRTDGPAFFCELESVISKSDTAIITEPLEPSWRF